MMNIEIFGVPYLKKGKGIHIKKKNRGKFTEFCGGKVTDECILKAKKSKNPKLRKRATFALNSRRWKHEKGGNIIKCLAGTTDGGLTAKNFNLYGKVQITPELKLLSKDNPEEARKIMPKLTRLAMYNYARAWYTERSKNPKYSYALGNNMDHINNLLDLDGYVEPQDVIERLGGRPVGNGGSVVRGGFGTDTEGNNVWFGTGRSTQWHEGIGHWIGDQTPSILDFGKSINLQYTGGYDPTYESYINDKSEQHAMLWEFRGLNKDRRDKNGNLYIDPNRQLTGEEVQEMIDNGAYVPDHWKNTNITPDRIADLHNTYAHNTVKRNDGNFMAKLGVKLIKRKR